MSDDGDGANFEAIADVDAEGTGTQCSTSLSKIRSSVLKKAVFALLTNFDDVNECRAYLVEENHDKK